MQSFKRKSFLEARKTLNDYCLSLDGREASSNKKASETLNRHGEQESWFLERKSAPPFDSPRCKAYLSAYIEIAGPMFYGSGIPLDRGLMHPDRGVMKAMLLAGCVTLGKSKRGLFELTAKGRRLVGGVAAATIQRAPQSRPRTLPQATRAELRRFVREKQLTVLENEIAHSIAVANETDPTKWGIRVNQRNVMLKVGFVEVLQAGDGWLHQLLEADLIPKHLLSDRRVRFDFRSYKNAPGCITCDFDVSAVPTIYQVLLPAHEAAIRIAARSPRHTTTTRDHSEHFIMFLSEELNETLPQPIYSASSRGVEIPEEKLSDQENPTKVSAQSSEGRRIWRKQQVLERDRKLTRAAKSSNRETNGGRLVCVACDLSDERDSLFDAHHLNPLASGIRQSSADDFAILCPTCHRWAHSLAADKLQPLPIARLRKIRRAGGR